jgi:phosphoribosylformylglycinamidine synthase
MLLGRTSAEFGGSLWAHALHGHLGGQPPVVDLAAERRLAAVLSGAAERGLLSAAHDLSDGGLAVALAECCLAEAVGCAVWLPADVDAFTALFSESAARALVEVRVGSEAELAELCAANGVPTEVLGRTGGETFEVSGQFAIGLAELKAAHAGTLPAIFG